MKYETKLIWILGITFGFVFFDRNAAAFLMPFITADLHFTNQQVGLIASALSFTWALGGLIGGSVSDRTGKRKTTLLVLIVAFSLCSVISGLAASFFALFAARLLMGLFEGPIMPICHSLIVLESDASTRGHNMGVTQNFGSNLLGSFVAPLVLVALATAFGWRVSFFLAAAPGLVMALLIARYVHEPKAHVTHDPTLSAERNKNGMGPLEMLKHGNIWVCILMCIFMVSWMVLGWAFLPLYYTKVRHFTNGEMSILMSVLGLSATFFSFVVPRLSDTFGRKPVVIIFNLIGMLVPLAVLQFHGGVWGLAVLIFIGWSASGTMPLLMGTIPSETIPPRYIATAVGLVMGLGEIIGGVSSPAIAGWAADHYGLNAPVIMQMGCAIIAAVMALFLAETAPIKSKRLVV